MVLSNNISKKSKLKKNLNSSNKSRLLHKKQYIVNSNQSGGSGTENQQPVQETDKQRKKREKREKLELRATRFEREAANLEQKKKTMEKNYLKKIKKK